MISLKHLMKCSSFLGFDKEIDLSGKIKFVTDTRRYVHPSAFVAIPGAKINPLDVIDPLLQHGCPIVIYQNLSENKERVRSLSEKYPSICFAAVTDSVTFLQELTNLHIQEWKSFNQKNTIFAISGSNGKTTHKEMLAHILKTIRPGKIVATEKNNNNHLGVPLTLLEVNQNTEFVVLELGSNHPGEIKVLCDISRPNAGITTNIGATHLEFFGDEKNVFLEEGYLYFAIKDETSGKGFYLVNMDDNFLKTLEVLPGCITYGEDSNSMAQVRYHDDGASFTFKKSTLSIHNQNITGKHNKLNLVTCAFIAHYFFPEFKDEILKAAASFVPTKNRSEWIVRSGRDIYLDAYNANPSSMRAALMGFKESVLAKKMKLDDACVVLGDMNELGDSTESHHREIGKFVKDLGFLNVYFVGRFREFYLLGFSEAKGRPSAADFKSEFQLNCLSKYQIHFIKGSRSLQLESLLDIT